jgi:hypothetical protein
MGLFTFSIRYYPDWFSVLPRIHVIDIPEGLGHNNDKYPAVKEVGEPECCSLRSVDWILFSFNVPVSHSSPSLISIIILINITVISSADVQLVRAASAINVSLSDAELVLIPFYEFAQLNGINQYMNMITTTQSEAVQQFRLFLHLIDSKILV